MLPLERISFREWLDAPSAHRKAGLAYRKKSRLTPLPVYRAKQQGKLRPDRCIGLERKRTESRRHGVAGSLHRDVFEVRFQISKCLLLNSHRGMTVPVADCIASELQRSVPDIFQTGPLRIKEVAFAFRGDENKEPLMPEIVNVGVSRRFPSRAGPLRDVDAVFLQQLLIHRSRIFSLRNDSRHVKPIAVRHVADRELLNEPVNGGGFEAVGLAVLRSHRGSRRGGKMEIVSLAQSPQALTFVGD